MKHYSLIITLTLLTFLLSYTNETIGQNQWQKRSYVDEFGDKTEQVYYSYLADGSFSNSATTNSPLNALFEFNPEEEYVAIRLYEYGNRQQKHLIYGDEICKGVIKVKNLNDNTVQVYEAFLKKEMIISISDGVDNLFEFIKESRTRTTNVKILIDMDNFCEKAVGNAVYTINYVCTPINDYNPSQIDEVGRYTHDGYYFKP